jgi:putative transposase
MKRKAFLRLRERYRRRGKTFIYADECGFEKNVTRRYGRAPRGEKIYGLRSGLKRPRTSLIAARVEDGGFIAPFLFPGTCDADTFNLWLETHLCPLLHEDHVVIIDNATFHKSDETAELIRATGATLLFLPPYSPDLSPVEPDFANIKKIREYNEHSSIDEIIRNYH